jgi:hypothetical protein
VLLEFVHGTSLTVACVRSKKPHLSSVSFCSETGFTMSSSATL